MGETLADTLRRKIAESGLSYYMIGKRSGVQQITVSRLARGLKAVNLETADKICKVLGLELREVEPAAKPAKRKRGK